MHDPYNSTACTGTGAHAPIRTLSTIVQPAQRAGAVFQAAINSGKLNGTICAQHMANEDDYI